MLFVTIYRLHRTVMPIIWKGYNNLTVEERRDWDTRFGTMVFSAYIVHEAIAQLVLDDFFFKEGPTPKILRVSHASNRALAISSGFFLYELVVTLKYMVSPCRTRACSSKCAPKMYAQAVKGRLWNHEFQTLMHREMTVCGREPPYAMPTPCVKGRAPHMQRACTCPCTCPQTNTTPAMLLCMHACMQMGGAPMVVHHCGSLACVALAYFSGDAHMFTIWMLSTECTTPFIAMRYLLDKSVCTVLHCIGHVHVNSGDKLSDCTRGGDARLRACMYALHHRPSCMHPSTCRA